MKVVKDKSKDNAAEPTYSLCGLSVKELKSIRTGLEMLWAQYNNNRIKVMIADINAGALKDHVDKFWTEIDPEAVKKQNKAVLKALGRFIPTAENSVPIPPSLSGKTYK